MSKISSTASHVRMSNTVDIASVASTASTDRSSSLIVSAWIERRFTKACAALGTDVTAANGRLLARWR